MFRSIDRHGRVGTALSGQSVALIVKRRAETAGLDPHEFAGHSLRAGFLTSAAEAGADVLRMMEVSRHKRVETVQGYVRRAEWVQGTAQEQRSCRRICAEQLRHELSCYQRDIGHSRFGDFENGFTFIVSKE